MKLQFPNGEHAAVDLKRGVNKVGSATGNEILLMAPGIASHHCDVHFDGQTATIKVVNAANSVALNGRQVMADAAIKPGDIVLFGKIGARVMAGAAPAPGAAPGAAPAGKEAEVEDGRTRVRQALPRYMLRGVSGSTLGKTFAIYGVMTIGRSADCDISIPADEISRTHAKVQVMPDGIAIEDLGSANGTFINDKRVHTGLAKHGDELRLDTVRFQVFAPHLEMQAKSGKPADSAKAAAAAPSNGGGSGTVKWILIGGLIGAAALAALYFAGLL